MRVAPLSQVLPFPQKGTCLEVGFQALFASVSWLVDYPHSLRYATMPSEHVCTENLTPFVKLLPCKAHVGIASLLNPHRLFEADWHGMSITVRWLEGTGIELRLGFGAVMDPVRLSEDTMRRGNFSTGEFAQN